MIRICPMCRNRQVNNVHARLANGPCDYCAGLGHVNTEISCKCGRPGVLSIRDKAEKFLGAVCTRFACGKALLEGKA